MDDAPPGTGKFAAHGTALTADPADPAEDRPGSGRLNAALTRAVVGVYLRHSGRGPTKAQAFFRDDVIVVVLRDVLTTGERNLARAGRPDAVTSLRRDLQAAMADDLIAAVEELTGCTVVTCLGQNHVDPDMAIEAFVLDRPVAPTALGHAA
jgi:uncharacterized protein YbcI